MAAHYLHESRIIQEHDKRNNSNGSKQKPTRGGCGDCTALQEQNAHNPNGSSSGVLKKNKNKWQRKRSGKGAEEELGCRALTLGTVSARYYRNSFVPAAAGLLEQLEVLDGTALINAGQSNEVPASAMLASGITLDTLGAGNVVGPLLGALLLLAGLINGSLGIHNS